MDDQIIGLKRMIKRIEKLLLILVLKNKPQINADERRLKESVSIEKDCLGMSTHGVAMCLRGVENPQGFGMMNADLMNR